MSLDDPADRRQAEAAAARFAAEERLPHLRRRGLVHAAAVVDHAEFDGPAGVGGLDLQQAALGHGLLGVLIHEGRPVRLAEIGRDPRSSGFPPNHPPMTSLLGVPISLGGKILGDLYLTDKLTGEEFDEDDERLALLLARHAAVAIENANLNDELERRLRSGRVAIGQVVERAVEGSEAIEPPEDVHAPVAAGQPAVPANREGDIATGGAQLVGELDARGRRTDHEDAAVGQRLRVAVVAGCELEHVGVDPVERRRTVARRALSERRDRLAKARASLVSIGLLNERRQGFDGVGTAHENGSGVLTRDVRARPRGPRRLAGPESRGTAARTLDFRPRENWGSWWEFVAHVVQCAFDSARREIWGKTSVGLLRAELARIFQWVRSTGVKSQ